MPSDAKKARDAAKKAAAKGRGKVIINKQFSLNNIVSSRLAIQKQRKKKKAWVLHWFPRMAEERL